MIEQYLAARDQFRKMRLERLHSGLAARRNDIADLVRLAVANDVPHGVVRDEYFRCAPAPLSACARQQPHAHDCYERLSQLHPNLLVFVAVEYAHDAIDGFRRIAGMECRENQRSEE